MAQRSYISFSDPNPDCLIRYIVEYKAHTDITFNRAPDVFTSPAVVYGLTAGVAYDFRITKECCDGTISPPTTVTYTPSAGQPFMVEYINNATTGELIAYFGVTFDVYSPNQRLYDAVTAFNQAFPGSASGSAVAAGTSMPLMGEFVLQNNPGNANDYNYTVSITDISGNPISGTTFPYTGTILNGDNENFNSVNYGTSTNGYKVTITLTDAT